MSKAIRALRAVSLHKETKADVLRWLGPKIRRRMAELGISVSMLARKTGIGVSTMSDYLMGRYDPSLSKVISLASVLEVDGRFFFERKFGLLGEIVTDGLVSYWSFDEGTIRGDIVEDVWGESHGTISGAPGIADGKIGNALKFDGDGHVVCGDDPALLLGDTDFSIALWFNADVITDKSYLIGTYSLENGKWYLLSVEDGNLIFAIDDDVERTAVNSPIDKGQWYHIVGIREKGKEIRIYVNGVLEASVDDQTGEITSDSPVYIGNRLAGERAFTGCIDEVAIYNRVLNEVEIMQNYAAEGNGLVVLDSIGRTQ